MPSSPVFDLALKQIGKRLRKARNGERRSGLRTASEAEAQNRFAGQCADQGDITWTRACVLPSERPVAVEILPPVAFADIPCTGRVKYVVLSLVDCCKRNTEGALLTRRVP